MTAATHEAEYAPLVATYGEAQSSTMAQHALWRVGDLSWLLHSVQQEARTLFLTSKVRRCVLCFARRLGKSFLACVLACECALSKSAARIPYAAPTGVMLREFIVPIMSDIAATAPDDLKPTILEGEVRFPNGSRIVLQGCEDRAKADRLRGPAADLAIVDEAGFIPVLDYVVRSVLLPQLITTDGKMLVTSSPPESRAHPFTALAAEAKARGAYMHRDIFAAPHISDRQRAEYCEEAGGPTSAAWQREGLALDVVDPLRAIVPEFSDALKDTKFPIIGTVPRPEYFDAYVVGDLGYVDLTVLLFAYWHFELARIVVEADLPLERPTSDLIQKGAASVEAELWGTHPVFKRVIDAPPITRADMSRLQDDDETSESRWSGARKVERDAAVNALRIDIQRRRYLISPRCTTLIAHLETGIWNARRTDFDHSEGLGHFDGVAAAVYLSRHVERNRNPNPAPVYDKTTHHVPAHLQRPQRSGWAELAGGRKR